jgi:outer membrane protein OmpA-like peptidoglycan-associated protein
MRQIILLLLVTIALSFSASAQKFKPKEKIKIKEANTAFFSAYYDEALSFYKSVYNKHIGSAFLNYRIGFCYLALGDYEDALNYFESVNSGVLKKKNADYYFAFGRTFHYLGRYEEALAKYTEFKQKAKTADVKYFGVDNYISSCNFAINSKENPVSVLINNLGDSINSKYNDYHPSVTADGKKMIFTSRREDSKGGMVYEEDGQYYEDVYETKWNTLKDEWGESKPVEGALNSDEHDANTSVSPDGKSILLFKNVSSENKKILSPTGGGDIYLSNVGSTGRWSAPQLVEGVNSQAMDGGACFSADGQNLYFISNRENITLGRGSQGGRDIWISNKQEDGTWGKPSNLGDVINTPQDEWSVFIHPNGKTLFFSSDGHYEKNLGGFDVFRSDFKDGKWTEPDNLGYPINSFRDEKEIVISTDGKVAWLSAIREENKKDVDIYEIDLKHFNVLTGESEILSILKGQVTDASTGISLKAKLVIHEKGADEKTVLNSNDKGDYFTTFASHRTYVITIHQEGYKPFIKEVFLDAPKPKKSKKRRAASSSSSRRKKKKKTSQTHTVILKVVLERENPIEVISKDLFKTQIIAFKISEEGYEINDFSKSILEMYARQQSKAPSIILDVSGHFEDVDNAKSESKKLADLVVAFLKLNGVPDKAIKVNYKGAGESIASNQTSIGRAANRRVEIRVIL